MRDLCLLTRDTEALPSKPVLLGQAMPVCGGTAVRTVSAREPGLQSPRSRRVPAKSGFSSCPDLKQMVGPLTDKAGAHSTSSRGGQWLVSEHLSAMTCPCTHWPWQRNNRNIICLVSNDQVLVYPKRCKHRWWGPHTSRLRLFSLSIN